jgi:hypothetical protein
VIPTLRSGLKKAVAGLVILGLLLQASLFVRQVSLMAAPPGDAVALALSVICTEHGAQTLPAQDVPADRRSACLVCPACWGGNGGPAAILLAAIVAVIWHQSSVSNADPNHRFVPPALFVLPPSRGPPAFA